MPKMYIFKEVVLNGTKNYEMIQTYYCSNKGPIFYSHISRRLKTGFQY